LRPVLAVQWLEAGYGVVPTEFAILVERLVKDKALKAAIDDLLKAKLAGAELGAGPRVPVIDAFLEANLERMGAGNYDQPRHEVDYAGLTDFFLETVGGR